MPSSINYNTLFSKLGVLFGRQEDLLTIGTTTLPDDLTTILTVFGTTNTGTTNSQFPVAGLSPVYQSLMDQVAGLRQTIVSYTDGVITDYDTVVSLLPGANSRGVTSTLTLIVQDMIDNGQTVQQSVVQVGAVTAASANVGNGTVLFDDTLDGFQAGVSGGLVHIRYAGQKSQLCPPSILHVAQCVSDSYGGQTRPGAEGFTWGDGIDFGSFTSFPEGAGQGPGLIGAAGSGLPQGGDFSSFSGGLPAGWTLVAGKKSELSQDKVNYHAGPGTSLKITGLGSGTVALKALLPQGTINPRRRYCVTFYALPGGNLASGQLTVGFTGTGYSPAAGEEVSVATTAMPAGWNLYHFYLTAPANVPSNFALQISVTNTLTPSATVNIDSLWSNPVRYFAGVNAVLVGGNIPFVVGDRFYCTVTSVEGKFQSLARQRWGAQWNSAPAGAETVYALTLPFTLFTAQVNGPTIPDTLAGP